MPPYPILQQDRHTGVSTEPDGSTTPVVATRQLAGAHAPATGFVSLRRISAGCRRQQAKMGQGGLEPPTPRLSSVCSNQLSYWPPGPGTAQDPTGPGSQPRPD